MVKFLAIYSIYDLNYFLKVVYKILALYFAHSGHSVVVGPQIVVLGCQCFIYEGLNVPIC